MFPDEPPAPEIEHGETAPELDEYVTATDSQVVPRELLLANQGSLLRVETLDERSIIDEVARPPTFSELPEDADRPAISSESSERGAPSPAPTWSTLPPPSEVGVPPPRDGTPQVDEASQPTIGIGKPRTPSRSRAPLVAATLLIGAGIVGVVGWQMFGSAAPGAADAGVIATATTADAANRLTRDAASVLPNASSDATAAPTDAAVLDAEQVTATLRGPADAARSPVDAAPIAAAPADAAVASGSSSDPLRITSKPAGARVFLDGTDSGSTPIQLPGSADQHTIALLLPGHDLYIAKIDGHGVFSIPLKEITPSAGPAGIKVIKCKEKDRYYVFVDGQPTGQMCPTERIETDVGPHTVEVFDAVTDSRKKWDIVVKDTRLSYRVKIE